MQTAVSLIITMLYVYTSSKIKVYSEKAETLTTVTYSLGMGLYYMLSFIWCYTKKLSPSTPLRRKSTTVTYCPARFPFRTSRKKQRIWIPNENVFYVVLLSLVLRKEILSALLVLFMAHVTYCFAYLFYILLAIRYIKKNKPCRLRFYDETKKLIAFCAVFYISMAFSAVYDFLRLGKLMYLHRLDKFIGLDKAVLFPCLFFLSWGLAFLFSYVKKGFLFDAFLYKSLLLKNKSFLLKRGPLFILMNKKLTRLKYMCVISLVFIFSLFLFYLRFAYFNYIL
jgi:hypothetical protein